MQEKHENELLAEATEVFEEASLAVRTATNPLVVALLGTPPFMGGAGSLLGHFRNKRQDLRLKRFLISLAKAVEENRDDLALKVDEDFLWSDRFSAILESILQEAASSVDERKLDVLRQFLVASSLRIRPDVTWQELYAQYIRQLSGVHLVILAVFFDVQGNLADADLIGGSEIPGKVPLEAEAAADKLGDVDAHLVKVASIDLANLGLLMDWRIVRTDYRGLQDRYCLSPSGKLFVRFLRGEWA